MGMESHAPLADPHIVGNAFVQKYYNHLYESPAQVHRFYLEDSVLGRPGSDGEMVSVSSLKAINEQIMAFDYENTKIQILTADSQASYKSGVVTLVTGLLTVKDGGRMRFSQSFFLVPQKGSYFVLNDVFRYVSDELVVSHQEEVEEVVTQVVQTTTKDTILEPASEVAEPVTTILTQQATETLAKEPERAGHPKTQEENVVDAPKKSFAVIVQSPAKVGVKASPAKPRPVKKPSAAPESKAPPQHYSSAEAVNQSEGGSIFVANLPMDATPEQLNETFKGFGAIRKDSIQVRSYRLKGNCFGFVTFESAEAVKLVLQAHKESAIRIGNRRVSIEEKRGNNENGRSSMRNDGFSRPRSHGRNGYERRGESRNGEANNDGDGSRAYQNGLVKANRENAQARG
ncbi:Nuclear transport factor 2 (NTF2) family protein with RNA binding (RRM-RBD-RNP motifs) domain [Raphanus sativus]|uniref:Nuclear transport factor 2-like isoform X1 n=1 Tax=Raphanus sativus TaxID=3726 RepID=A0A9W3CW49_RAPSA|nr:nuclear transport factor 2-like isoform X1 [Raphanus sativus]XP_056855841.1 nuclear transport factor 2-like isoform X1 [Raphanus sativus]KAJ4868324.1 Nuclear transport factor 2 (NTF2) family protein with RNA binding (RRM-RBD-RNP motifs) domain [Raphanus sativus]